MNVKTATIALILIIAAGLIGYLGFYRGKNENKIVDEDLQLKIETLQEGSGPEAKNGDTVRVNYVGTLEDGTQFDSYLDRENPFSFVLGSGQVIIGWEIGISGMKVGEKRRLTIAPEMAYGQFGVPNVIPPNATLIFEVELLGIN